MTPSVMLAEAKEHATPPAPVLHCWLRKVTVSASAVATSCTGRDALAAMLPLLQLMLMLLGQHF